MWSVNGLSRAGGGGRFILGRWHPLGGAIRAPEFRQRGMLLRFAPGFESRLQGLVGR